MTSSIGVSDMKRVDGEITLLRAGANADEDDAERRARARVSDFIISRSANLVELRYYDFLMMRNQSRSGW